MTNYRFIKSHEVACNIVKEYVPESKFDEARLEYMKNLLVRNVLNDYSDAGIEGKIWEVSVRPSTSRLIEVQPASARCDLRVTMFGKTFLAECKINGGRLGKFYSMKNPGNVPLVYHFGMEIEASARKEARFLTATICTTVEDFLERLESVPGAVKIARHNNKNDAEPAIQKTQRLYRAIKPLDIGTLDRNNFGRYF